MKRISMAMLMVLVPSIALSAGMGLYDFIKVLYRDSLAGDNRRNGYGSAPLKGKSDEKANLFYNNPFAAVFSLHVTSGHSRRVVLGGVQQLPDHHSWLFR